MISKASFELLLKEGRSFEEYFRFEEDTPPDDLPAPDDPTEPNNTIESAEPSEPDSQPSLFG